MTENQAPYAKPVRPAAVEGVAALLVATTPFLPDLAWERDAARYILDLERRLKDDPMVASLGQKVLALESRLADRACATCGRDTAGDGDCYGCQVDRLERRVAKLDTMTAEEGAMILWVARYGERHQKPAIAMSFSTQDYRAMAAALLAALRTP